MCRWISYREATNFPYKHIYLLVIYCIIHVELTLIVPLQQLNNMDTERNGDSTQKAQNESFIKMPDLFASIMAVKPCVNPHYFEVKPKAESWIVKYIELEKLIEAWRWLES